MENAKYLIGDVANLMGMSRDTLRYYEKRGILNSQKGANGYRYYTDQDISRLVGILYQRKMNISLEDMETLWNNDTLPQLAQIIQNRIREEEEAIQMHRQTIARLRLTQSDCQRLGNQLDQVMIRTFPSAYIIVPETDWENSTELWFQLGQAHPGLDMMYTFDEYRTAQTAGPASLQYRNTQLILYRELAEYVDYNILDHSTPVTESCRCLYCFCYSAAREPDPQTVRRMYDWAKEHGLSFSDRLFSTYAMQGIKDEQHTYYQEIYIPLL